MPNAPAAHTVLILCEYFPPSGNTAAQRPYAWLKYFHEHGLYPVIFCRDYRPEGQEETVRTDKGEVHYIRIPDEVLRPRIDRAPNGLLKTLMMVVNTVVVNALWYSPKKRLMHAAAKWLKEHHADLILATGSPFVLFSIAARLSRKKQIPWVADYRDDWTTDRVFNPHPIMRLLYLPDVYREKKALKSAAFLTTVSAHYRDKLSRYTGRPGYVIENGYLPEENTPDPVPDPECLTILFGGLIYPTQPLHIVRKAVRILQAKGVSGYKFVFLGSDPRFLAGIPDAEVLPRVPRREALLRMVSADFLLYLPFHGPDGIQKGVPGSKLYDYLFSRRPILVCGDDGDIVSEKLRASGQGIFCHSGEEMAQAIERGLENRKTEKQVPAIAIPEDLLEQNTRSYQTRLLCQLIRNQLTTK